MKQRIVGTGHFKTPTTPPIYSCKVEEKIKYLDADKRNDERNYYPSFGNTFLSRGNNLCSIDLNVLAPKEELIYVTSIQIMNMLASFKNRMRIKKMDIEEKCTLKPKKYYRRDDVINNDVMLEDDVDNNERRRHLIN